MIKKPVTIFLESRTATNVGPADHFSVLSLGSVAVGNAKTGPAPQTKPTPGATGIGFFGEKKKAGLKSPQPEIGTIATEEWRLVDHRHDRAGDQVPILIEVKRDNRLNVEDVLGVIELTHAKVRIVLKRRRPDQTRPECRPRRRRPPRGRRVTMATTGQRIHRMLHYSGTRNQGPHERSLAGEWMRAELSQLHPRRKTLR